MAVFLWARAEATLMNRPVIALRPIPGDRWPPGVAASLPLVAADFFVRAMGSGFMPVVLPIQCRSHRTYLTNAIDPITSLWSW